MCTRYETALTVSNIHSLLLAESSPALDVLRELAFCSTARLSVRSACFAKDFDAFLSFFSIATLEKFPVAIWYGNTVETAPHISVPEFTGSVLQCLRHNRIVILNEPVILVLRVDLPTSVSEEIDEILIESLNQTFFFGFYKWDPALFGCMWR
jgi:hypothetical protein